MREITLTGQWYDAQGLQTVDLDGDDMESADFWLAGGRVWDPTLPADVVAALPCRMISGGCVRIDYASAYFEADEMSSGRLIELGVRV